MMCCNIFLVFQCCICVLFLLLLCLVSQRNTVEGILQHFYVELVRVLPLHDAMFRSELITAGLLPGNLKSEIKSMPTPAEKTEHFLDCGIKNEVSQFQKLVSVMEGYSDDNVQKLARHIKDAIASKIKQGAVYVCICIQYVGMCICDRICENRT